MAALSVTTAIGLQQFGGALRPSPIVASSVTYGGFYCKQQQQQQQQSLFQVSTTIVGAHFLRRKLLHERSSKKMGRALICAVAPVKEEESSSPAVSQSSGTSSSVDPLNVLVTGSTKGVGLALAREFLRFGDNVVICSRSVERVENTVQDLKKEFEEQKILGMACDVRDSESIQALVDMAKSKLGHIDIWINNAGTNAYTYKPLVEFTDADIMQIVETNTLGVMLCCRQVLLFCKFSFSNPMLLVSSQTS
jgi:ssDNA-binding Zn-finger/Zn-ribbon topoisomerase 1